MLRRVRTCMEKAGNHRQIVSHKISGINKRLHSATFRATALLTMPKTASSGIVRIVRIVSGIACFPPFRLTMVPGIGLTIIGILHRH
jgi:hypothetical protein